MKICVSGARGRMGRRILELAAASKDMEIGSGFDLPEFAGTAVSFGSENDGPQNLTLGADPAGAIDQSDVLIDFTLPQGCMANVAAAAEAGKPSVVGTTGLSRGQQERLGQLAQKAPIVFAPNMSIGVNLLFKLTREVAAVLGLDYNIEIVEMHHNKKTDSPSGTAVRLAECAAEVLGLDYAGDVRHGREGFVGMRPKSEIGMHALRGGDVAGEHMVSFIGPGERIELTHRAHSRDNFARGALVAVRFVMTADPGLYDMQDVLGLR